MTFNQPNPVACTHCGYFPVSLFAESCPKCGAPKPAYIYGKNKTKAQLEWEGSEAGIADAKQAEARKLEAAEQKGRQEEAMKITLSRKESDHKIGYFCSCLKFFFVVVGLFLLPIGMLITIFVSAFDLMEYEFVALFPGVVSLMLGYLFWKLQHRYGYTDPDVYP